MITISGLMTSGCTVVIRKNHCVVAVTASKLSNQNQNQIRILLSCFAIVHLQFYSDSVKCQNTKQQRVLNEQELPI